MREGVRAAVREGLRAAVREAEQGVGGGGGAAGAGGDGAAGAGEAGARVLGRQRAFGASFRFFVAFFTVSMLGSSSSAETGGAFASWHAVHVVFRPGSPALSNLRKRPE